MGSFNGLRRARQARPMGSALSGPVDRSKLIRAVHAACRKLGLDDDARRDIQIGVTKKASLKDMDAAEINLVLARIKRHSTSADRPHIGKVRALWWSLYWLGAVEQSDARAIDAFVERQTGVAALRFLDHRQAHSVVDALKGWCRREGVLWPLKSNELLDRQAVLEAIWRKLHERGAGSGLSPYPDVEFELSLQPRAQREWQPQQWDAAIALLGKRLRKALGKS